MYGAHPSEIGYQGIPAGVDPYLYSRGYELTHPVTEQMRAQNAVWNYVSTHHESFIFDGVDKGIDYVVSDVIARVDTAGFVKPIKHEPDAGVKLAGAISNFIRSQKPAMKKRIQYEKTHKMPPYERRDMSQVQAWYDTYAPLHAQVLDRINNPKKPTDENRYVPRHKRPPEEFFGKKIMSRYKPK
jgi:hypothetical protein